MASKKKRILKKEWADFLRDFNRRNQFRRTNITLGEDLLIGNPGMPLAGLLYQPGAKRVEVYLGGAGPEDLAFMAHAVNAPRAIYVIEDSEAPNPVVGLQIQGPPKTRMTYVTFQDSDPEEVRCQWTANVAYSLFEKRGKEPGDDQRDWYEAEQLIRSTMERFV